VIPPQANAALVASMEDVLEVYHRPHDQDRPVVCLDETTKHLIKETRVSVAAKPGQPARHDYEYEYEYERNGTVKPVHAVRAVARMAACRSDRTIAGARRFQTQPMFFLALATNVSPPRRDQAGNRRDA
jgi:hypothetical protein